MTEVDRDPQVVWPEPRLGVLEVLGALVVGVLIGMAVARIIVLALT